MSNGNPVPRPPKLPKAPSRRKKDDPQATPPNNWRGIALFGVALALVLFFYWMKQNDLSSSAKAMNYTDFVKVLEAGQVKELSLTSEPARATNILVGKYDPALGKTVVVPTGAPTTADAPGSDNKEWVKFSVPVNLEFQRDLLEVLKKNGFNSIPQPYIDNQVLMTLLNMLPILLFILLMYFFFRQQIRMAGKGAFSFGKSKAKMLSKDRNKITFKDVAGVDEAREEVSEIVEFLKDPKRFQKLGGRIPKGVLMVGPPGTGKTLLAKAIAGEADVPFYGISGSDFVEMFVGVGASRVRDMFEQGRKTAPCLIFIDEIDAVGRSRGHGLGGGHDEREQTLNAMLVEMDGIDTTEGVIIIAATNRKDVLDPALLRPGRFDREVRINLPDVKGREQILKVHSKAVKAAEDVDWSKIARGTPGFSGAELANLINEAALLGAKRNADAILQSDLEEARDKVRWGRERRSMAMTDEQKKITAYHEAGHAILNLILENTDPLHKVSIIPRGPALGVTMMLPKEDRYGYARKYILDDMCVFMGGRVAEEIFIGDVSSGASGDIRMATYFAKKMICEWGMSEKLGMVEYGDHEEQVFLGRDIGRPRGYSEQTAREIDSEVLKLTTEAHRRARQIITEQRAVVEAIAQALLEFETLDGDQIGQILKHGKMLTPPPKNITPPTTPLPQETLGSLEPAKKSKPDDGMLPGLQGAPAGA